MVVGSCQLHDGAGAHTEVVEAGRDPFGLVAVAGARERASVLVG